MSRRRYLPERDSELIPWTVNFVSVLSTNAEIWEIPREEVDALRHEAELFESLYEISASPERTSVIVSQKNTTRVRLVSLIRRMVNFRLKNPIITNAQLISLGLYAKDKVRTPIPIPSKQPYVIITALNTRLIEVIFQDQNTRSREKPYGYTGAVIAYAMLDTPPRNQEELIHTVLATKTPYTFTFKENDRGKIVYFALRWQNRKGQLGPWTEIMSTIVP